MRLRAIAVSATLAFGSLVVIGAPPASAAPPPGVPNCPHGQPPDRPPGQPGQPGGGNGNGGGSQGRGPNPNPGRPTYPPGKCELGQSSSSTAAGTPVTFSGAGYQAGEPVAISLSNGTNLATVTADPQGAFSDPVMIPASTKAGTYQVLATGAENELTGTLEVTSPAVEGVTQAAPKSSSGSSLPFTGAVVMPMLALAAGLLLAGAFMLRAAHRRRDSIG